MSDTYTVLRTITIDAPPEKIYALISDFHEWSQWSPWDELDPDMKKSYSGQANTVGAGYAWSGNRKAGVGSMTMKELDDPGKVVIDLKFEKPFKSQSTTFFDLHDADGQTKVTWTMEGPKTFMVKVMGLFKNMDAMVGPDFEKGLDKLKAAAEAS